MPDPNVEIVRRGVAAFNRRDLDALFSITADDAVFDWSRSIGPQRGVLRGTSEARVWLERFLDAWDEFTWNPEEIVPLGPGHVLLVNHVRGRGKGSGVEVNARGAQVWRIAGGRLVEARVYQDRAAALSTFALERARVYFVCDARPGGEAPGELLDAVLGAGAGVVQLREKDERDGDRIAALAEPFRRAATEHDALFFVNDRPELVGACGADGVHVGQDDVPVAEARRAAGRDALVGLSTHAPAQLDAACAELGEARPDYLSVGPVWETPTKAGRPATGLDYVRYAATHSTIPWFAIGGIDPANVAEVAAAGAERVVAVRAIRNAGDPAAATRALVEALDRAGGRG